MTNYEKYQIDKFKIQFEYPSNWGSEIEEYSTYLFFDKYLGSFRITPISIKDKDFNLMSYLNKEFEGNLQSNSRWELFNERMFVCYEHLSKDVAANSKLNYYISGENDLLLLCSYAYDLELLNSEKIKIEFEKVEHILKSIEIIGA